MKFYYFYSPSYTFYHEHIQERLSNQVDLHPILIDEIPEIKDSHHFTGLTIKIDLIIDAISQNMGKEETIIFSDATIFIHPENGAKLVDHIKQYHEYDLCFINESWNQLYNIGFLTIKCTEKTLLFFKYVREIMPTINHDQVAINYLLQTTSLNYVMYDSSKIYCGEFKEELRDSFIIYKSGIQNIDKKANYNQRIQNFYDHRLIDFKTYCKNYIYDVNNYAGQACQDGFVVSMTNQKRNGYFLEIGTNHPIEINNSYILEKKYGWKGLLVEYDGTWEPTYLEHRTSPYIIQDATTVDYLSLFRKYEFPKQMDYLQIDLEVSNESTMKALELLDATIFPEYTFSVVTFEHDIYTGDHYNTRERSREIFRKNGYFLLFPNVSNGGIHYQFEDWYIYPSAFPVEFINSLQHPEETMEHTEILRRIYKWRE